MAGLVRAPSRAGRGRPSRGPCHLEGRSSCAVGERHRRGLGLVLAGFGSDRHRSRGLSKRGAAAVRGAQSSGEPAIVGGSPAPCGGPPTSVGARGSLDDAEAALQDARAVARRDRAGTLDREHTAGLAEVACSGRGADPRPLREAQDRYAARDDVAGRCGDIRRAAARASSALLRAPLSPRKPT